MADKLIKIPGPDHPITIDTIILNHHRAARDLKYRITMIDTIETNVPLRPLNTVTVATKIHRYESA